MWKLPPINKKKRIETKDKKEITRLKREGFEQKRMRSGRYVLEKRLQNWELFQEEVRTFLEALNFRDTESGQSSWLGKYQIDVVGGYDGTFVVFECKSTEQPGLKTLTKEINTFTGKKAEIEQAVREKFGTKYNEIKFILALNDIELSEDDEKTASENNIFIWDSNYLATAKSLFSIIGPLTLHYILKELGVSPKTIRDKEGGFYYKVPSFRLSVNEEKIYSFFLPAEKLLNLVYVFRLQPGKEEAYQRLLKQPRLRDITEFINNGGFFKNNIVCSFEERVRFEPKSTGLLLPSNIEFGILEIPKLYGTVWIIDGQHRLYGYAGANVGLKKMNIGVVAYEDIGRVKQAKDFIDINQKQKKVDPNMLWDLLSLIDSKSVSGTITKVVKLLNTRGIFKNKIFIPGKSRRKRGYYDLTLANICNGLRDRKLLNYDVKNNLYRRTDEVKDADRYPDNITEYPVMVLDQYFSLLYEFAKDIPTWRKGFILTNNGFNVFLRILVEVLHHQRGNWNKIEAEELLVDPLRSYFEEKQGEVPALRLRTSNEGGRQDVALEVIQYINQTHDDFAREYIGEIKKRKKLAYERSEPYQLLKDLESVLRFFIEGKLSSVSKNWWKERVPVDVKDKAEINRRKSNSPWPWVEFKEEPLIYYIDFPDYAKLIQMRNNWRDVFQKVFKDPNMIGTKLRELEPIRNSIAHSRNITDQESTTLKLYSQQIIETIRLAGPKKK